jgi:hypothetical protein
VARSGRLLAAHFRLGLGLIGLLLARTLGGKTTLPPQAATR